MIDPFVVYDDVDYSLVRGVILDAIHSRKLDKLAEIAVCNFIPFLCVVIVFFWFFL